MSAAEMSGKQPSDLNTGLSRISNTHQGRPRAGGVVRPPPAKAQYALRDQYIAEALASGKFVVEPDGRVFNTRYRDRATRREVVPYWHPAGYPYVTIKLAGQPDAGVLLHRVVAIAIHGLPPDAYMDCDHIDGDKANFHPSNLQWVSRSENVHRAYASGLKPSPRVPFGEASPHSVMTNAIVRKAHRLRLRGILVSEIAMIVGHNIQTVQSALAGKSWRRIYQEFHP